MQHTAGLQYTGLVFEPKGMARVMSRYVEKSLPDTGVFETLCSTLLSVTHFLSADTTNQGFAVSGSRVISTAKGHQEKSTIFFLLLLNNGAWHLSCISPKPG